MLVGVADGALGVGVDVNGTLVGPDVAVRVGKSVIAIVGTGVAEGVGVERAVEVRVGVAEGLMVDAGIAVGKLTTRVFNGGAAVGFRRITSVEAGLSMDVVVGVWVGREVAVDFGRRITRAVAVGSIGISVASTSTLITDESIAAFVCVGIGPGVSTIAISEIAVGTAISVPSGFDESGSASAGNTVYASTPTIAAAPMKVSYIGK